LVAATGVRMVSHTAGMASSATVSGEAIDSVVFVATMEAVTIFITAAGDTAVITEAVITEAVIAIK